MILLPHLLVGAAIGAKVHNFAAVFILNIILHFLADMLPHWEYFDGEIMEIKSKKQWLIFLIKVALDFTFGVLLVFYFFWQSPIWLYVAVGALSAVLPDFFIFLYRLFPEIKILQKYYDFHYWIHREKDLTKKTFNETALSIFSEGLITLVAFYFIISF